VSGKASVFEFVYINGKLDGFFGNVGDVAGISRTSMCSWSNMVKSMLPICVRPIMSNFGGAVPVAGEEPLQVRVLW